MSGGTPVTIVQSGGAPVTPVGLSASMVSAGDRSVQSALDQARTSTEFPAEPSAGDRVFRSDRGIEYFYDGARWLSVQVFDVQFNGVQAVTDTAGSSYAPVPFLGEYSLWLERFETTAFRDAAGEWDIVLQWWSAGHAATTLVTIDGAGDPSGSWVTNAATIGAQLDANARALRTAFNEVSGAANYYAQATLRFRLIG